MCRILISGGDGKFATCLKNVKQNQYELIALSHKEMDVEEFDDVYYSISRYEPDYFIHAAAMTRPLNKHKLHPNTSLETNVVGTFNVTENCRRQNVKLIYLSTDYVYPGVTGNYKETDSVLPFTHYGWSKLGGECVVQMYPNTLILRLGMIEYPFPHLVAFINMIKSCMYNYEIAEIVLKLLDQDGIINVGGPAQSIYDFIKKDIPHIQPESCTFTDKLNTSMNIKKLKKIIND